MRKLDDDNYISTSEVLKILKCSKGYFLKHVKDSLVNVKNVGRAKYYFKSEVYEIVNKTEEILKNFTEISEFSNYYINKIGEIVSIMKSYVKPIFIKPKTDRYGYKVATLTKDGKKFSKTVHRLVAKTFIKNPNNLPVVNHIDGNKKNNNVKNLEWCTVQENTKHAKETGLIPSGIKNKNSCPVMCFCNNGKFYKVYASANQCAIDIGIDQHTVLDSHNNGTVEGKCGYFFRKISREKYKNIMEALNNE